MESRPRVSALKQTLKFNTGQLATKSTA